MQYITTDLNLLKNNSAKIQSQLNALDSSKTDEKDVDMLMSEYAKIADVHGLNNSLQTVLNNIKNKFDFDSRSAL